MAQNTDLDLQQVFLDAEEMLNAMPVEEKLASLSALAREQLDLEQQIARDEALLSEKKEKHRLLCEVKVPELMDELGIDEFKLSNGVKVTVSPYFSGKITDPAAYKWLEDNNQADIIKGEISIPFPKGFSKQQLKAIVAVAREVGLNPDVGEQVHPSTLRAWIKDMVTKGQQFPRELFNVYVGKRTKLSLK